MRKLHTEERIIWTKKSPYCRPDSRGTFLRIVVAVQSQQDGYKHHGDPGLKGLHLGRLLNA